jgi:Uncharacterized protein conserved in bacteria (DUF2188)
MAKGDVYVVWRDGQRKWAVEVEGNSNASSLHDSKEPAVTAGRARAKANRAELLVHDQNGQIKERNTYKKDPFPPRG